MINNPLSAPIPEPTKIAVGVANPKAQGQAITNTAMANFKLNNKGAFVAISIPAKGITSGQILVPNPYQNRKVKPAKLMTK